MTVGARLRSKAASSLPRCGPLARGRGRTEGDEEAAAILEHLENGAEAAESEASARRPESRGARRVHLAVLPERYEPLEEQVPSAKPIFRVILVAFQQQGQSGSSFFFLPPVLHSKQPK